MPVSFIRKLFDIIIVLCILLCAMKEFSYTQESQVVQKMAQLGKVRRFFPCRIFPSTLFEHRIGFYRPPAIRVGHLCDFARMSSFQGVHYSY